MPGHHPARFHLESLLTGWTPRLIGRRITILDQTESTNTSALQAADDAQSHGLAVFADYQTGGRGRQGRSWQSPRGASVLCSVLLRLEDPPAGQPANTPPGPALGADGATRTAGWLTLASAVAACEAVREATEITPAIKWPNDLRVGGRKLGGILIESRPVGARTRAWVVGIGINCYQQAGHFPPDLRDRATSLELLSSHAVDRTAVARELLKALDCVLTATESAEQIHTRWLTWAEPLGQRVTLRSGGREYSGRTVAVDPAGGLILQCDDGRRDWFDPLLTTSV